MKDKDVKYLDKVETLDFLGGEEYWLLQKNNYKQLTLKEKIS